MARRHPDRDPQHHICVQSPRQFVRSPPRRTVGPRQLHTVHRSIVAQELKGRRRTTPASRRRLRKPESASPLSCTRADRVLGRTPPLRRSGARGPMGIAWVPNGKSSHSFWVQQQKTVTDAALFDTWALVCGRMSGIVSHAGLWMVALAGPHLLTVTTVALRHTRSGQHDCVRTTTTRHSTQTHTRGDLFLSMTYVPACFVLLACSRCWLYICACARRLACADVTALTWQSPNGIALRVCAVWWPLGLGATTWSSGGVQRDDRMHERSDTAGVVRFSSVLGFLAYSRLIKYSILITAVFQVSSLLHSWLT